MFTIEDAPDQLAINSPANRGAGIYMRPPVRMRLAGDGLGVFFDLSMACISISP